MKRIWLVLSALAVTISLSLPSYAVTLKDDADAKIDLYGKINMLYAYDEAGEVNGNLSRLGVKASSDINSDAKVFANAEFRYDASERNKEQVFNDRRNTYVGIDSSFGKLTAGNFSSVYYQAVSSYFDFYYNYGFVAMGDYPDASVADSLAYTSPKLLFFQLSGQLKHCPPAKTVSGDEELRYQFSGSAEVGNLYIGLGTILENDDSEVTVSESQSVVDGTIVTEETKTPVDTSTIMGGVIRYTIFEGFDVSTMFEHDVDNDFNEVHAVGGLMYSMNIGSVYASAGRDWTEEIYFAVGGSYQFSKPMNAFVEYANGEPIGGESTDVVTVGLSYVF